MKVPTRVLTVRELKKLARRISKYEPPISTPIDPDAARRQLVKLSLQLLTREDGRPAEIKMPTQGTVHEILSGMADAIEALSPEERRQWDARCAEERLLAMPTSGIVN